MIYQNRQNGFAPIIIVLLVVVGIGTIGGVAYFMKNKNPQEEKLEDTILERNQERISQYENLPSGTSKDLIIGEEVMVRGATNPDGSITAEMIFIGEFEDGFRNMRDFSPDNMTANVRPNRFMPEGFNPEEFQNLSREEIMERMREMRDSGAMPSMEGGISHMGGGTAFIRGEIIDKDEMSITVKLIDSGSRLVFYSDDTEIRIPK